MPPEESPDPSASSSRPDGRSAQAGSDGRRVGRHRAVPDRAGNRVLTSTPVRVAVATGVACCLGLVVYVESRTGEPVEGPVRDALADRSVAAAEADERASRALTRTPLPPVASPTPTPSASASRKPARPAKPVRPRPVAGLTQVQMDNAKVIVDVGDGLGLPRRAMVVAVATAMQESTLRNLANEMVPESLGLPHQGTGADHDSVGLFQQRPSSGWGSVRELMRPAYAARVFYEALRKVPGWQQMSIAAAAQAVQISAFPDAYAQHEQRAATVVDALT